MQLSVDGDLGPNTKSAIFDFEENNPYFLSLSFLNGYRSKRIENIINSKNNISLKDCKDLQIDFYSIPGKLLLNGLLKDFKSAKPKVEKVLNAIRNWDGFLENDSAYIEAA